MSAGSGWLLARSLGLRPLLARPGRTLLTIAGVALGVASVLATLLASRAAVASLHDDVEELAGAARVEITHPGGVELGELTGLRELGAVARVAPVVEATLLAPALGDLVRLLGLDLLVDGDVRELELETGPRDLAAARDELLLGRGAALSQRLAATLGLGVGDRIELLLRSRPVELEVVALFEPRRLASAWDRVVVVDVALAQELLGRGARVDRVELAPRLALEPEELARHARALVPAACRVGPASLRREDGEALLRSLEFNLTALSGVSVLVGIVLVATTLATSIVERRASIALLRSLGAARGTIAGIVLLEAGAIGCLGGALGVLLGWRGALAALTSVRATVASIAGDALPGEVRLPASWVILGLALGLGSSLGAGLLALREALRTPPVQGLRGEREAPRFLAAPRARLALLAALAGASLVLLRLPPLDDRPVFALLGLLCLFLFLLFLASPMVALLVRLRPRPGAAGTSASRTRLVALRLAQAALARARRRAAWAAGAAGAATGLAVAMSAMVGSFRTTIVDWTARTMRSDLYLRPLSSAGGVPAGSLDPELARLAAARFGPERVDPYREIDAYAEGRPILLGGGDFGVMAREGSLPFVDGRPSSAVFADALARGAALVNESFALRFRKRTGDRIEIEAPAGKAVREIAGVYRDYSGHIGRVVLDGADFARLAPGTDLRNVAVFLPQGADVEAERRAFAAEVAERYRVEILDGVELAREIRGIFERTFAFTVALEVLASIVAALGIATVLGALVQEQRRELSLLRALGASRAQVFLLVVGEALLLGLAGALAGVLVGLVVGHALVTVVNVQSFGWTMPFAPSPGALVALVALVLPASALAGIVPALTSLRSAPREALREVG
jgi:putative ABC transport system permease protein